MKSLKDKKGFTLIELVVSMLLLSIVLLFLHGLINNIVFSENENHYENSVSNILIISNLQNDLIKYGLYYEGKVPVTKECSTNCKITFTTTSNTANLKIEDKKITYTDVNLKKYTWNLTDNLTVDKNNITSSIEDYNDGHILYTLVIPIYDNDDNEDATNNKKTNDIRINYFGKKITS